MTYYSIAILKSPLTLTYKSDFPLTVGEVVTVTLKGVEKRGVVIGEVEEPPYPSLPILRREGYRYRDLQRKMAHFISTYYLSSLGEAFALFIPAPFPSQEGEPPPPEILDSPTLTPQQQEAANFLLSQKRALLFGDTGSGKTEIYISLFQQVLQRGERGIFLMPEISLTPQMEERLRGYFGESVAIWHSQLTRRERQKRLEALYSGRIYIVAGPRSALSLPLENLGLIVVDEEHDDSYKAPSRPRIHGRDLALMAGKFLKIPVILGSATPAVTSYAKFPHYRLRGSYHGGGYRTIFDREEGITPTLLSHLERVVAQGKQAIIFLPTRGHFKYLQCQRCGDYIECPFCDVGMSLHLDRRVMLCHYCNIAQPIPTHCPSCGSSDLSANRLGTKEVGDRLKELFPSLSIGRFDRDRIKTHRQLRETLQAFSRREIDILVGTQMLSKGHDYPDLALTVVMGIDYLLAMADYRARERALSLFLQVAGRAGRRGERGDVIVQTKQREFFESFRDYEEFVKNELELRRGLYPPSMRLARLLFTHKREERAREAMEEVLGRLRNFDVEIVGYGKSPIERIAGRYRYHILIRSPSIKKLLQGIYGSRNSLCEVDIDPVDLA
ncbi:MAG: primosomal protein N' [Epsilonproteobacteria bacterium]|nr:primosomal protein N' [Campylobacterota bacterium]NPA56576.1 primosomal protein N' [Campylobacterota bacterium]